MITCDPATCDHRKTGHGFARDLPGLFEVTQHLLRAGSDQQSWQESVKSQGFGDRVPKQQEVIFLSSVPEGVRPAIRCLRWPDFR